MIVEDCMGRPDPEAMLRAEREQKHARGPRRPTEHESAAARVSLQRHPERDRLWGESVLDALRSAGLQLSDLRCDCGSVLTDYCMTGCPSNSLRRLLAAAFNYGIPGLCKPTTEAE